MSLGQNSSNLRQPLNEMSSEDLCSEILLEERNGAFVDAKSGAKISHLKLCSAQGLISDSDAKLRMAHTEMVGVHKDGARLSFVGYRLQKGGCLTSARLIREEVVVMANGRTSDEENAALANQWYTAALRLLGRSEVELRKPLLVFINPMSGPRVSVKMWNEVGNSVIVKDGGHAVKVITTERANHALEFVKSYDDLVNDFKGIVIVSGDGLMYEVLQGIMQRKDWSHCIKNLPIGILPAGSGNGLARSIHADAGLPHSALAASVLVARGSTKPLDVGAVDIYGKNPSSPQRVYSFLSLEWALVADIDIGSEYLRSLGELRFTIEGLKRWMFLRKYCGRLSYLPVESTDGSAPRSAASAAIPVPPTYWEEHGDQIDSLDSPVPPTPLLPTPSEPVPDSWTVIEDTFWNMWNCNTSWMSGSSCIAPDAKFSDGYFQMQYMRESGKVPLSKWKLLMYLLGLDGGSHQDKDFVEMMPSRAYRFEPTPNKDGKTEGTIAIDGEVVEYTALQMQNLRGFLKIYATGIY